MAGKPAPPEFGAAAVSSAGGSSPSNTPISAPWWRSPSISVARHSRMLNGGLYQARALSSPRLTSTGSRRCVTRSWHRRPVPGKRRPVPVPRRGALAAAGRQAVATPISNGRGDQRVDDEHQPPGRGRTFSGHHSWCRRWSGRRAADG
ncbi:hypothetical protein DSL92_03330 [Billgrantia gudaonensis]|uniref:Uncharacterized protein n=1 Tax=Billgrantia gudaonensis TaxID=376427 RepID=A0A432JJV9_9GAMM|nr:hypothetical protein DSL92_03330 [Halomonas gudaonensis]